MKKRILCDLDDVLSCFNEHWISLYNEISGDNLRPEDITEWDLTKFVLPEWKERLFTEEVIYRKGFFKNTPVKPYAMETVKWASERFDLYIVSASYFSTVPDKAHWIMANFPFFDIRKFVPCYHKHIFKADFMIDDGIHNLQSFEGEKMLMDMPWNRSAGGFARYRDLREVQQRLCGEAENV